MKLALIWAYVHTVRLGAEFELLAVFVLLPVVRFSTIEVNEARKGVTFSHSHSLAMRRCGAVGLHAPTSG